MSYSDRTLTCSDCGAAFTFTTGEQEFYASRGFTNEPRRCPTCRAANKAATGGSRSSGGGYGGGGGGGGGSYGTRSASQMYSATCGSCGKEAQVPFQPRGDRPVYCNDCFRQRPASPSRGGYR